MLRPTFIMSLREMIFFWAENFHALPSAVEDISFSLFCEEYNDFKLKAEWEEFYKAHTTHISNGKARVPIME